jgi:hypothetical protein
MKCHGLTSKVKTRVVGKMEVGWTVLGRGGVPGPVPVIRIEYCASGRIVPSGPSEKSKPQTKEKFVEKPDVTVNCLTSFDGDTRFTDVH